MPAPNLSFSYTRSAISDEAGYDSLSVTFSADMAYTAFECRATKAGAACGRGVGTLIASFSSTPVGVARTFEIYDTHLVSGDGQYRISLYAQGQDGSWNDNASFVPAGSDGLRTVDGDDFLCMN